MTRRLLGIAWLVVGLSILLGVVCATWAVERVLVVLGADPTVQAATWVALGTGAFAGSLWALSSRQAKDRLEALPRLRT